MAKADGDPQHDARADHGDAGGGDQDGACPNPYLCMNGCPCPSGLTCLSSGKCAAAGTSCSPSCPDGAACSDAVDCSSGACNAGVCGEPACSPTCANYSRCGVSDECLSGFCYNSVCEPNCPAPATALSSSDALAAATCAATAWQSAAFPVFISSSGLVADGTSPLWYVTFATNVATSTCATQSELQLTVAQGQPVTNAPSMCSSGAVALSTPVADSTSVVPTALMTISSLAGDAGVGMYGVEIGTTPFASFPTAGGWQVQGSWWTTGESHEAVVQFGDSGGELACELQTNDLNVEGGVVSSTSAACP